MKKTIYLVTGAAGFLGGTVCRQLVQRGEKVRAFVLPNDKATKYIPDGVEISEGDLRDLASLESFFEVPEGTETVVLHIASIVTVNPDYNQDVINVNVGGTENIIYLCRKHKECRKLVYCSSTGAIPELPKGNKIREVGEFEEEKVVGCYSQSKARATQLVLDAVGEYDLDACVVHPSGIFGPEDYAVGETTGTLIQIINGEMPMGINGSFNLCDVRDLADGVIMAASKGRKGECYILGNEEVTFRDFTDMVVKASGCRKVGFFLPLSIGNLMAKIMEKQAARKGTKPLLTEFSIYNLARNNCFDSAKAARELGYSTRSYSDTINDEISWLKEAGLIA